MIEGSREWSAENNWTESSDTGQNYMSFIICESHTKYYLDKQIENEMGRPCLAHDKLENTCTTILKTWRATNSFEYYMDR
jgi:hypothetical protein